MVGKFPASQLFVDGHQGEIALSERFGDVLGRLRRMEADEIEAARELPPGLQPSDLPERGGHRIAIENLQRERI